jgi:hypothetical protein
MKYEYVSVHINITLRRVLEPAIIPRVSAIAQIGFCERAAFNISFFGMEFNQYSILQKEI